MSVNSYFDALFQPEVAGRQVSTVVHKFGRNSAVGTGFAPVSMGAIYRTPQVGSATRVRVKAGNAADTAAGAGARKIFIQGLTTDGSEVSEELTTAGESAGANSYYSYIRIYRAYVSESGTYATQSAGSHTADIVIENSAGTEDWLTISSTGFPRAQSQIACYSIPLGYEAYIGHQDIYVDSNKTADVVIFQRRNILDTAAPYAAMRTVDEYTGIVGEANSSTRYVPIGPFPELTDIGYMAKAATSANISISFDIFLFKMN